MIDKNILADYSVKRVGLAEGPSKSDIAKTFAKAAFTPQTFIPLQIPGVPTKLLNWILTVENVDKVGAWAKKNVKLIEKLTQNKLLPSSVRLYLRSVSGSKTKITEDFFSKSELAEIKKRVTEAEVSKALMGHATSGAGSMGRAIEGHSGIGYESDKAKTLKNAFTDDAVNIDMTFGQAGFYRNKDGTYQVYDKHNFSNMLGQWDWYANAEDLVKQVWALDDLYATDIVAGKVMRRYDLNEPNRKPLAYVIEAYKNEEISLEKLIRTIGGYLASDETTDVVRKDTDWTGKEYEYVEEVETEESAGVPISLNIGPISQTDKYKVDKKQGWLDYDETWDAKMKGEYADAPTMGQEYAQMIFDDARTYPWQALGHPSGKSPGQLGVMSDVFMMGEYEDVGIPSAIRMEAQKYIKKRELADELDPNWQNVRMKEGYYWDKDLESKLTYGPQYRHLWDKPDLAEGVPWLFWDETLKAQEYQDRGKPHIRDYDLVPYATSESGEDLYPGFKKREYKEFKDGGIVSLIQNYK